MTTDSGHSPTQPFDAPVSRRRMMRSLLAAVVGAGATAVLGDTSPAAASTGTMYAGTTNYTGPDGTTLSSNLTGVALTVNNPSGYGLSGESATLYGGYGTSYGVNLSSGGVGVQADGALLGVYGMSTPGVGVAAYGGRADLILYGYGQPPMSRSDLHGSGEVLRDSNGDVWVCVESGAPGTWRKLAGPASAGSFHAVEPSRVYDSRWLPDGRHTGGGRDIYAFASRNLAAGDVENAQLIPQGARALNFTITATSTIGNGYAAVTRRGAPAFKASCLNWSGSGQSIANTTVCEINPTQQPSLKVWNVGSTHIIIDVLGYYL
jgi:hypothetical protein